MMERQSILLALIRTDGGTQARVGLNQKVLAEYIELVREAGGWPAAWPPVVVFNDGTTFWLADGFHRTAAARQSSYCLCVPAEIIRGSRRDAILYAVGANATHGCRRTNADKRNAIQILLSDPQWSQWSDNEIAKRCQVSNHLVGEVRKFVNWNIPIDKKFTTKHGTVGTRNSNNNPAELPAHATFNVRASFADAAERRQNFQYAGHQFQFQNRTPTGFTATATATGQPTEFFATGQSRLTHNIQLSPTTDLTICPPPPPPTTRRWLEGIISEIQQHNDNGQFQTVLSELEAMI